MLFYFSFLPFSIHYLFFSFLYSRLLHTLTIFTHSSSRTAALQFTVSGTIRSYSTRSVRLGGIIVSAARQSILITLMINSRRILVRRPLFFSPYSIHLFTFLPFASKLTTSSTNYSNPNQITYCCTSLSLRNIVEGN
jgi:hypothetical protein